MGSARAELEAELPAPSHVLEFGAGSQRSSGTPTSAEPLSARLELVALSND